MNLKITRTSPRGATNLKTWILTVLGCLLTNLLKFLKNLIWEARGVLEVGEDLKKQGFPCIFLAFSIVIYKGKIIAPTSRAPPGPPR